MSLKLSEKRFTNHSSTTSPPGPVVQKPINANLTLKKKKQRSFILYSQMLFKADIL